MTGIISKLSVCSIIIKIVEACSIFNENIITLVTFKIVKLVNEAKKLTLYLVVNLLKLSFNFIFLLLLRHIFMI